jgi:hypothetical protein
MLPDAVRQGFVWRVADGVASSKKLVCEGRTGMVPASFQDRRTQPAGR